MRHETEYAKVFMVEYLSDILHGQLYDHEQTDNVCCEG